MNTKVLTWSMISLLIISILSTLGFYIFKFHSKDISLNTTDWGTFGDFIAGTLGTIVGILNLVVLTFLTLKISKSEDERNKYTLQELARPLGHFFVTDNIVGCKIEFINCGLGPLKMTNISIAYNGETYKRYDEIITSTFPPVSDLYHEFFHMPNGDSHFLSKEERCVIIEVVKKIQNNYTDNFYNYFVAVIRDSSIEVEYRDMYDREMPVTRIKLADLI